MDLHELRAKIYRPDRIRRYKALRGIMLKTRGIGPLTLEEHKRALYVQNNEVYNEEAEMLNVLDDFNEIGVTPFIDVYDAKAYIAARESPQYYWNGFVSRTVCIIHCASIT